MNDLKHLNIRVVGAVQGVFYRKAAQDTARDLGLTGFARNEPDGSVYIEVEGDPSKLEEFVAWCNEGSEGATVTNVQIEDAPPKHFPDFQIK